MTELESFNPREAGAAVEALVEYLRRKGFNHGLAENNLVGRGLSLWISERGNLIEVSASGDALGGETALPAGLRLNVLAPAEAWEEAASAIMSIASEAKNLNLHHTAAPFEIDIDLSRGKASVTRDGEFAPFLRLDGALSLRRILSAIGSWEYRGALGEGHRVTFKPDGSWADELLVEEPPEGA